MQLEVSHMESKAWMVLSDASEDRGRDLFLAASGEFLQIRKLLQEAA